MDAHVKESNVEDECEILLDEDGDDEQHETDRINNASEKRSPDKPETCDNNDQPTKELTPHQIRMQQLLLKMNQARQLNRQAVQEEGTKQARPTKSFVKKGKADSITSLQAAEAVQQAQMRSDRQDAAQHSMHDYHNPEAQHRQYQRSVRSIHHSTNRQDASDTAKFDPLVATRSKREEKEGAHRLAQEMHRRIEKKRKNEAKKKEKEGDVAGHINKRNKQFNKKLERNYQEHVKEIQQNLERGTAL